MPLYAYIGVDTIHAVEPHLLDSNQNSVGLIQDVNPGTGWGVTYGPAPLWKFGASALFLGFDEVFGNELWITDGTADGTRPVADIASGVRSSSPSDVLVVGDVAYFTANTLATGTELWRTDGTPTGTFQVTDILPGASGSKPYGLQRFLEGFVFSTDNLGGIWYFDETEVTELTEPGGGFGYASIAVTSQSLSRKSCRASDAARQEHDGSSV